MDNAAALKAAAEKMRAQEAIDDSGVDGFCSALKSKMLKSRLKGRSGWEDPAQCSVEFLADLLIWHLGKGNTGNFEDIGCLAMMLHQRGADPKVLADAFRNHLTDPGYVRVPVEPTMEMLDCIMGWQSSGNVSAYRAMLAAATKETSHD